MSYIFSSKFISYKLKIKRKITKIDSNTTHIIDMENAPNIIVPKIKFLFFMMFLFVLLGWVSGSI
jgi:hypothetical protein